MTTFCPSSKLGCDLQISTAWRSSLYFASFDSSFDRFQSRQGIRHQAEPDTEETHRRQSRSHNMRFREEVPPWRACLMGELKVLKAPRRSVSFSCSVAGLRTAYDEEVRSFANALNVVASCARFRDNEESIPGTVRDRR